MISAKRIANLGKKWQMMTALGRKHLTWRMQRSPTNLSVLAGKGHCVVYTAKGRRFEVPLAYLEKIFEELLEEFGFSRDGRIMLPCDAATMEYAMCLLRKSVSADVETAFLSTMSLPCHYKSLALPIGVSQQVAVCST